MIAWPIPLAKASGLFDTIIVSTEDKQVADVAREHGAEIPFHRPAALSDDYTGTTAVVAHAVQWAKAVGWDWKLCAASTPRPRSSDLQTSERASKCCRVGTGCIALLRPLFLRLYFDPFKD